MRLRNWIIILLVLVNLVLCACWYIARIQEDHTPLVHVARLDLTPRMIKTNVVVRRVNITWSDIESTNLAAYITNLEAVGCPPPTIRDFILAQVNLYYGRRRSTEVVTPDQQWWRSDPDPSVVQTATEQLRALETERRSTLDGLLGSNWETESDVLAWLESNYGLTGPQLGTLPPETKRSLYDIATLTTEQLEGRRGGDASEAALIRQHERAKLQAILTPAQLTEYLLRYSQTAQQLRELTRGLSFQPDQFQSLFAAVDPILSQPDYYYRGTDPTLIQRQQALAAEYDQALRQALGDELYTSLQLNRDPVYVSTRSAAQQAGFPDRAVAPLYQINRATQAELARIRNDSSLSDADKIEALATTQAERQKSIEQLVGAEAFKRWLQIQSGQ